MLALLRQGMGKGNRHCTLLAPDGQCGVKVKDCDHLCSLWRERGDKPACGKGGFLGDLSVVTQDGLLTGSG